MKFSATINLAGIDDAGLSDKTDLADWVILEYIADWYTVPKATKRADKVWINYRHLIAQIPIIGIKSKSAVSSRIHKLAALGLLIVEQDDDGRMFASLGQVAIDVRCFRVDRSPDREGVRENERGVRENERGGVRENEHTVDNQFLSDNHIPAGSQIRPQSAAKKFASPEIRPAGSYAWDAYASAYLHRYRTEPVRNAKTNGQFAQLAKRLPGDEIEHVVRWYVSSNASHHVRSKHCVDLLLRDCEGLRTEWATGARMTDTEARQIDQHDAGAEAARWVTENMEQLRQARREGKI